MQEQLSYGLGIRAVCGFSAPSWEDWVVMNTPLLGPRLRIFMVSTSGASSSSTLPSTASMEIPLGQLPVHLQLELVSSPVPPQPTGVGNAVAVGPITSAAEVIAETSDTAGSTAAPRGLPVHAHGGGEMPGLDVTYQS